MSILPVLAVILLDTPVTGFPAGEFIAPRYQQPDGAITLYVDGDRVDPYFSIKALLAAHAHGLDIRNSAHAWIDWLLPRQLPDGRFERYCREAGVVWKRCAPADADDALLALWLELLHTLSPDSGLPDTWKRSVNRAEKHLALLFDRKRGIYRVSREQRLEYLMDNVEIYAALKAVATHQRRIGYSGKSRKTSIQAHRLRRAIDREFWLSDARRYRASLQDDPLDNFYPDIVAQIYPWLADMATPAGNHRKEYQRWHDRFANEWLTFERDEFPWGLVALASLKFEDRATAAQWYDSASPLRHTHRWNILEEAAYQIIEYDLIKKSAAYRDDQRGQGL